MRSRSLTHWALLAKKKKRNMRGDRKDCIVSIYLSISRKSRLQGGRSFGKGTSGRSGWEVNSLSPNVRICVPIPSLFF